MTSRKKLAAFINQQLNRAAKVPLPDKYPGSTKHWEKCDTFHYGVCELRELMDFIYGGPPRKEEEEVR